MVGKSDIDIGQSFRIRAKVWLGSSVQSANAGCGLGFYMMPRSEYEDMADDSRYNWHARLESIVPHHGISATVRTDGRNAGANMGFSARASTYGFAHPSGACGTDAVTSQLGWSGCGDKDSSQTLLPGNPGAGRCSCFYQCTVTTGNTCPHIPGNLRVVNRNSWATFELKMNNTRLTMRWDGQDVFNGATMPGTFNATSTNDWVFLVGEPTCAQSHWWDR